MHIWFSGNAMISSKEDHPVMATFPHRALTIAQSVSSTSKTDANCNHLSRLEIRSTWYLPAMQAIQTRRLTRHSLSFANSPLVALTLLLFVELLR